MRSVHGDWQIRCDTPPGAQTEQCALIQSVVAEDRSNAGSTRQSSFVFQLTLVEVKRGVAVWTEEKIVTKQGSKNAVGF